MTKRRKRHWFGHGSWRPDASDNTPGPDTANSAAPASVPTAKAVRINDSMAPWEGPILESLDGDDLMPFGKWKGTVLRDVPDAYWKWFLGQDWSRHWPSLVWYAQAIEDGETAIDQEYQRVLFNDKT